MDLKNIRKLLSYNLINSAIVGFRYLPFKQALKLPILVGYGVHIHGKGNILLSGECRPALVRIEKKSNIKLNGCLEFQGRVHIKKGLACYIADQAQLIFGDQVSLQERNEINCIKKIAFGTGSLVSWGCIFLDSDFHPTYSRGGVRINNDSPIIIGEHVWIGCHSLVLKGSSIGHNSVVGAGSVVAGHITAGNCIYAGIPAKLIRRDIEWKH